MGGGGFVSDVVRVASLGTSDFLGITKKEDMGVNSSATQELKEDAKDALKKRKALYETSGGVLGEEVSSVGSSSRGNIFGNR